MLPDDRLKELLQRAEDQARPDPEFLDGLFGQLRTQRRHRRVGIWGLQLPRPVAAFAVFAPLVLVIGFVGVVALGSLGIRQPVVGASPSAPGVVATANPTPVPSSTPTPTPAGLCFKGTTECTLAAGIYTTAPSTLAFHFTLGDGWSNNLKDPTGGEIATPSTAIFWLVDAQGGDQNGNAVTIGTTTDAVVMYLQKLKNVTTSAPVDVTIGGVAARQIDVTSTTRNNFVLLTTSGTQPGGVALGLRATTNARFLVLERSGRTLTIVVLTDSPTDFAAVVAASQPVLDSIAWD